ncbi:MULTISPECIES: DUF488 family protein [Mesorhizobium]|uniref:DUF488 domain-containing protein n=1 Tax=Mesorhizobium wenxiniae TaxID=2014805 RepID=A0A271KQ52_9HYPH|nr:MULTISPECIES: DUF488 domain-containing protein [Mesorhizobium]MCF6115129.1 DUF488 domain-containing protein [Mesorhizobium muleiense]PAP97149.1 hypothetical protein CIT31_02170 [Mesorhizobium wenxiniae]RVD17314.1 DUF488 domain-containing protein [Mesorhizobium sp. M7A.F.Ca.ET.027.02.1.1]RWC98859.1 MAG: DUF488 domain-containing protein [Mesorhizobium sp.]RWD45726.1 MAG: DUF488 domain-containing protein [Mesorhizobium sp.]
MVELATIGFTKTTAANFFDRLKKASVKKIIDVRLHNTSQLAGFAKADDLAYFLKEICGVQYVHQPILAPTDDLLKAYKRDKGDWGIYERSFLCLMEERRIEIRLKPELFSSGCLLCSEDKPHHCHRRLVCEYLNSKWDGALKVRHL